MQQVRPAISFADDVIPALSTTEAAGARVLHEVHEGAYSRAGRWLVELPGGERAFVKAGRYPDRGHGLHLEHAVCNAIDRPFVPRVLAWHEGDPAAGDLSVLVLEDLSHARWRTPLERPDVQRLADALTQLTAVDVPAGIPDIAPGDDHVRPAWSLFERDGAALVATGLVDADWLDAHALRLAQLEARVELCGSQLVHLDLWLQNWCRLDDRGAVIVDWSGACRGNARINDAWGECAVRAGGGPGGVVLPAGADDEPQWAAWMCARALDFAVQSANDPRDRLRETILREAAAALAWLVEACDVPMPQLAEHARVDPAWRP